MNAHRPIRAVYPSPDGSLVPMTDQEFNLYQKFIEETAGIFLCPAKKGLVAARLSKRVRELGYDSFIAYYKRIVEQKDDQELLNMLDRVSTNLTHFFREQKQFQFLDQQVFPKWATQASAGARPKRIRVWSAGCSTGDEPYSIAMTLLDHFPRSMGWEIEILATDLSPRVLDMARAAVWPTTKATEIPSLYLKRFMLKGTGKQEGKMKAGPEIRSVVRFERLNLNDSVYPVNGPFDLIFCCNVLIYFDHRKRPRIIQRLLSYLAPSGYFFVGHAENLSSVSSLTSLARRVTSTIYTHAAAPQPALKVTAKESEIGGVKS